MSANLGVKLNPETIKDIAFSLSVRKTLQEASKSPLFGELKNPFADLLHPLVDKMQQAYDQKRTNIDLDEEEIDYLNKLKLRTIQQAEDDRPISLTDITPSGEEVKHELRIPASFRAANIKTAIDTLRELNTAWISAGGTPRPAFLEFQASRGNSI